MTEHQGDPIDVDPEDVGGYGGIEPHDRRLQTSVDAQGRDVIEPDRDAADAVAEEERAQREAVHTDRRAEDDMRQAQDGARDKAPGARHEAER